MKVFNAFQMVCCFAACPLLINWLHTAQFPGAGVAFWVALVSYMIGFVALIACVTDSIERGGW